jgi:ribosome biogenesis GTPase A
LNQDSLKFHQVSIVQHALNVNTIMQVIDARDPLTYRSSDLEDYAHSISRHKGSMLLLNKSDLLPEVPLLLTLLGGAFHVV